MRYQKKPIAMIAILLVMTTSPHPTTIPLKVLKNLTLMMVSLEWTALKATGPSDAQESP
jgi:hypothetical protein